MSGKTVVLCVIAAVAAGAIGGLRFGSGWEKQRGLAAYRALSSACAEERRLAAEAHTEAMSTALAAYEAEVHRMRQQAVALAAEKKQLAGEARQLRREMARATRNSTHVFSTDFVWMLNRATGGISNAQAGALPESADSGGTHGTPGAARAVGAGLCGPGRTGGGGAGPVTGSTYAAPAGGVAESVTEADLGAWILDYAERCRMLEVQLDALQQAAQLAEDAPDGTHGRE